MLVDTISAAKHMEDAVANTEYLSIDTETNKHEDIFRRYLVGISVATEHQEFYIPVGHVDAMDMVANGLPPPKNFPDAIPFLMKGLVHRGPKNIIMHNAKFDLTVLENAGLKIEGTVWDTMLMSYLVDEHPPHGLKELGKIRLDREEAPVIAKKLKDVTATLGYEGVHPAAMAIYAEQDARLTYDLYFDLLPELEEQNLIPIYLNDFKVMECLRQIELRGARLDQEKSLLLSQRSGTRMDQIRREIGFDPAKPKLLADKLYGSPPEGLGLIPASLSPKTQKPKMDEAVLAGINHPVAGLVLEYRGLAKAKSTWYDGFLTRLDQGGRIHPNFRLWQVNGRPSCENPNLSQIPRETDRVKMLFLPDEDCELWEFDFSQQEYHLAALYGNETAIIERLRSGEDFHSITADLLNVERYEAKQGNFATIYGGQAGAVSRAMGTTYVKAQEFIEHMQKTLPGLFAAMREAEQIAWDQGWVQFWNGRRRHFKNRNEQLVDTPRKAFNAVCQGGGFEITKVALINLHAAGYRIINQVYDSVWINMPTPVGPSDIEKVKSLMTDWTLETFDLKFKVDAKRMN